MPRHLTPTAAARLAGGCLAVALAGALAACGSTSPDASTAKAGAQPPSAPHSTPTTAAAPAAAAAPGFQIDVLEGMRYSLPVATAPAGTVRITLVNRDDDMPHQAQLFALHKGATMQQFTKVLLSPGGLGATLALADPAGGPDAVGPGQRASVLARLAPATTYAVICTVPGKDGTPHYQHGMITSFHTKPTASSTAGPSAPSTITLVDDRFQVPSSIDWSKPVAVVNKGGGPHELQVLGPAPGKTIDDVEHYLRQPPGSAPSGPPPYRAYGGVAAIAPGTTQVTTLGLPAGHYLLVCFVPDAKTHVPHFLMGMLQEITVP